MDSGLLDDLDRRLAHALQLDGRASFSTIAAVLASRTRRSRAATGKLRSAGVLRVVGVPEAAPLGQVHWLVRLRCVPDVAAPIATALARRPDTQWVSLMSGGTEIACFVRAPQREDADGLILGRLPRTPRVVSMTAYRILHRFAGGPAGWAGRSSALRSPAGGGPSPGSFRSGLPPGAGGPGLADGPGPRRSCRHVDFGGGHGPIGVDGPTAPDTSVTREPCTSTSRSTRPCWATPRRPRFGRQSPPRPCRRRAGRWPHTRRWPSPRRQRARRTWWPTSAAAMTRPCTRTWPTTWAGWQASGRWRRHR